MLIETEFSKLCSGPILALVGIVPNSENIGGDDIFYECDIESRSVEIWACTWQIAGF